MALEKRVYEVKADVQNGMRIAGQRVAKGDKIELTEDQAHFLVIEGTLEEVKPAAEAPTPKGKAALIAQTEVQG